MATREQLEKFLASGPVVGHHPPVDDIPYELIRDYSPRVSAGDYSIGISPKRLADGTWRGVFSGFGTNWNPFAVDLLKRVLLDYNSNNDTLESQESLTADDGWVLEKVVVTIMNCPVSSADTHIVSRVFRDTLDWKHTDGTEFRTMYDWPSYP